MAKYRVLRVGVEAWVGGETGVVNDADDLDIAHLRRVKGKKGVVDCAKASARDENSWPALCVL